MAIAGTDDEILDVFKGCLPALQILQAEGLSQAVTPEEPEDQEMTNRGKRSRPDPEQAKPPPKGGKGKGGRKDSDQRERGTWSNWERNWERNSWESSAWRPQRRPELEQLLEALCRLSLKQEEELQLLRTEKQFLLHLESGPQGLLHPLWKVAQAWKAGKDKSPPTVTSSLRVALIKCMLVEWIARLDIMTKDEETLKKMEARGWVKVQGAAEPMWNYQQWNAQSRRLELDSSRDPIGHSTVVKVATELQAMVKSEAELLIHRFHSTRKLTETIAGDTLPFILSIALRGSKAQQTHDAFNLLAGNAALRLVGVRLRSERMNLQPLAQHIAKMAAALRR